MYGAIQAVLGYILERFTNIKDIYKANLIIPSLPRKLCLKLNRYDINLFRALQINLLPFPAKTALH